MILEEKGVTLNIPDGLRWEKFDEEDFYRDVSHLGLKAVDFVLAMAGSYGWMCREVLEELEILKLIVNEALDRIEKELVA